jgi:hypothetical protein
MKKLVTLQQGPSPSILLQQQQGHQQHPQHMSQPMNVIAAKAMKTI